MVTGSPLTGSIMKLATSRGIIIGFSFVTVPIISRLFPPATYGTLNLLMTLVTMLTAFSTLSYASALPLTVTSDERRDLFVVSLIVGIFAVTTASAAVILGSQYLAKNFNEPDIVKYAWFFPFLYLASAAKNLMDITLGCQRKFTSVAIRSILEVVVTRFSQLGLCLVGMRGLPIGLLIGALCGSVAGAVGIGIRAAIAVFREATSPMRLANLREAARRHRKFPMIVCGNQTLNAITLGLPAMLLAYRFSVETVGLYGMALVMVRMPIQLFSQSSTQVFYVEAGRLAASGRSVAPTTMQLVRMLTMLTAFPLTVVLVLGPLLFELFLGSQWRGSGSMSQILFPWMVVNTLTTPLVTMYLVRGRQSESLVWNVLLLIVRFSALYFGGLFFSVEATLGIFVAGSVLVLLCNMSRAIELSRVSRRWVAKIVLRQYAESLILLIPAGVLYWVWEFKIGSVVALALACAAHASLLHFRYPHISKLIRLRLATLWTARSRKEV